jgi:antitoxin MazE
MQVARWGNSLAVRIPVPLAAELGLSEGKAISLYIKAAAAGGFAEEQAPFEAQGEVANKVTVGKWGNSLGVRLPKALAEELGLVEGSDVSFANGGGGMIEVEKTRDRLELLKALRKFRGMIPADFKFDREEANSREPRDED